MIEILKVVVIDGEEKIITELVKPEPVEFRVYYDNSGSVLFYSCEKLEGNYLVIDSVTYAEKRFDLKVVDGKLIKHSPGTQVHKYQPSDMGISCAKDDISILVSDAYNSEVQHWKMVTYEL